MRKVFLLLLSTICSLAAFAQTVTVTEKNNSQPIINVSIYSNNPKASVTTNSLGQADLSSFNGADSIWFKHIAYSSQVYSYSQLSELNFKIVLMEEILTLEHVLITSKNNSSLDQPSSIVKVDSMELKRGTGLFLDDALNTNVPGVFMERRTNSGGQQINIRGYGNGMGIRGINGNFDSQGLKLYLNGIPITDAEGITVMDDIDFGSISNVAVSKGPSGTLDGLAIAGAVNLQTQRAEKNKVSVGQEVIGGSYGLLRTTTRVAIGNENSSILVNYGHQKFDGFMAHTKSHKDFVNMVGDFNLSKKQSITSYIGYSDSYDERNGELTKEQYAALDYSGNSRYIKNNAHSAVKTFRGGIGHTYRFNEKISNSTTFFGSSQSIDQSSAGGWTDKVPLNYGLRSVFQKQFNLSENIVLSGITGIEMQRMNAITMGYAMAADSTNLSGYNVITRLNTDQATISSTYSYFTQWTLQLPKNFSLTAGIGISNMILRLEDRLWGLTNNHPGNSKLQVYETKYNGLASPSFAINKKISDFASVYASYSVGYKAPVGSNILISTTGQLNTGLKPEKGTQIEIGTKGSMFKNRLFYTIAAFNAKFENKFTSVAVPNPSNTATLYSYTVNGGQLNNNGLEVLVKYNIIASEKGFIKLLQPFANLTYSNFKYGNFQFQKIGKNAANKDSLLIEDYSGNTVAGVSPFVYNFGVDVDTKIGLYGNINYNYRSAMYYTSDELNKTAAFSLLNAKIGFRKAIKHAEFNVYAGANNITSSQYYYMVFVNQIPDAYLPAPNKINYFGGVNLKYIF
jgi:iron complex outermembrane receptor protein